MTVQDHLFAIILTFGIVTPLAAERAALEEDGRTDAVSVVDRELLNVEDEWCTHMNSPSCKVTDLNY